jgi:hypothetical protein
MELEVGPFDPALHIRSRDHYEGVRREAQLLTLQPDAAPRRLEQLVERLTVQFPPNPVDEIADRAYLAGEPTFTAKVVIPDELVPAAIAAVDQIEDLLVQLDAWARDTQANLLEAPEDVKAYRRAYLAQAREQLQAALDRHA